VYQLTDPQQTLKAINSERDRRLIERRQRSGRSAATKHRRHRT
jgi:hypothetical protein